MRLIIVTLLGCLMGCSTIETRWFLKADEPLPARIAEGIQGLAYQNDEFQIEIWSASPQYRTMYGPPLLPVIPDEPPVLNDSQIHLSLRIVPRVAERNSWRVALRELAITSKNGKVNADLASWYRVRSRQRGEIGGTFSRDEMPEYLSVQGAAELELAYFSARFSDIGAIDVNLAIESAGRRVALPPFRLTPKRDRHYQPWVFPIAYPGVR